jgi:hypothetical protein
LPFFGEWAAPRFRSLNAANCGVATPSWSVVQVTDLIEPLGARGYTDTDIRNILGERYLRVFTQVWK